MSLVLEIAKCPNLVHCISTNDASHPCSTIILCQGRQSLKDYQLPEPWRGHISEAGILFISSNPNYKENAAGPTGAWEDDSIVDYFENCFDGERIKNGNRAESKDGTQLKVSRFWSAVARNAERLVGAEVQPGRDYALTEIVHCKSRNEAGVKQAIQECTDRFLDRVLTSSGAKVFVVLGAKARKIVLNKLGLSKKYDQVGSLVGPKDFFGRERLILFMPHPNARQERTVSKILSKSKLAKVRAILD